MTKTREELKSELVALQESLAAATRRANELQKMIATAPPMVVAEPPRGAVFSCELQYVRYGPSYLFVFVHVPSKGYYSTAVGTDEKFFKTWPEVWAFLNRESVSWRGPINILKADKEFVRGRMLK